jgi:hypothetical protein
MYMMNQFDKVRPTIEEMFNGDPEFYKTYLDKEKLFISFSDMAMAITAVGWDIFFLEIYHKLSPTEKQLAYGKVCKDSESLFKSMTKARDTYEKPDPSDPKDRIGFAVDLKHIIDDRIKEHPKFVRTFSGFEKLFIVFDDILILIEPIGGSFYNWELFERQGDLEVNHIQSGAKVGFDKIRDIVLEMRERYDNGHF